MNYYYDTEFLEGTQKTLFGETRPTIDLISIGIVAEDGREYYAISKDFNLKEAWNRFDLDYGSGDQRNYPPFKIYWIRKNVLFPIWKELFHKDGWNKATTSDQFNYKSLKNLINKYGKTNKQIAEEVKDFVSQKHTNLLINNLDFTSESSWTYENRMRVIEKVYPHYLPKLYGYYSAYDHVALCWLFGKMIDLPSGFPMYTRDLQQLLEEKVSNMEFKKQLSGKIDDFILVKGSDNLQQSLDLVKGKGLANGTYPKQENEHNALADARWNQKLHEFIKQL